MLFARGKSFKMTSDFCSKCGTFISRHFKVKSKGT